MTDGADTPDVTPDGDMGRCTRSDRRSRSAAITFSVERILAPGFGHVEERPTEEDGFSREKRDMLVTENRQELPVWVHCSRFSARPTAGPRRRSATSNSDDRRCRTAFSSHQVSKLRAEFQKCEYLSENERRALAQELGLTESQVKIWFQNARAKRRRRCGRQSPLAQKLAEAGLYNHSANPNTSVS